MRLKWNFALMVVGHGENERGKYSRNYPKREAGKVDKTWTFRIEPELKGYRLRALGSDMGWYATEREAKVGAEHLAKLYAMKPQ